MLTPPASLMIYVATQPVDFRKGADGLVLLAKETLGHDPMKGVAVVFREIGSDESQRLDVVPAQYRVIVTRRPKLACRACHGIVLQHAAPERLIKGGLPTERLVAHVIDAKYHWHLPLYRQAQMLATHGIALDRSTLAFWVGYGAQELKPLWHRLRQLVLASSKLCVDETPAPVLDPGRGRTKTGYFWALSRDDRPWAGPLGWYMPTHRAAALFMA